MLSLVTAMVAMMGIGLALWPQIEFDEDEEESGEETAAEVDDGALEDLLGSGEATDETAEDTTGDTVDETVDATDPDQDAGITDQVLTGTVQNDLLLGGQGNDTISAGDGIDYLSGGDGDDVMTGGGGTDLLLGDAGDDLLSGGTGSDALSGGLGADTLQGDSGKDLIVSAEILDDTGIDILGDLAVLRDMTLEDVLSSGLLDGAATDADAGDVVQGGTGDDVIVAGNDDLVTLGDGADAVIAGDWLLDGSVVTVTDYDASEDVLLFSYTGDTAPEVTVEADETGDAHVLVDGVEVMLVRNAGDSLTAGAIQLHARAA